MYISIYESRNNINRNFTSNAKIRKIVNYVAFYTFVTYNYNEVGYMDKITQ